LAQIPTITIQAEDGGVAVINAADYDPEQHRLAGEPEPQVEPADEPIKPKKRRGRPSKTA